MQITTAPRIRRRSPRARQFNASNTPLNNGLVPPARTSLRVSPPRSSGSTRIELRATGTRTHTIRIAEVPEAGEATITERIAPRGAPQDREARRVHRQPARVDEVPAGGRGGRCAGQRRSRGRVQDAPRSGSSSRGRGGRARAPGASSAGAPSFSRTASNMRSRSGGPVPMRPDQPVKCTRRLSLFEVALGEPCRRSSKSIAGLARLKVSLILSALRTRAEEALVATLHAQHS